jgi:hypothetical protein
MRGSTIFEVKHKIKIVLFQRHMSQRPYSAHATKLEYKQDGEP